MRSIGTSLIVIASLLLTGCSLSVEVQELFSELMPRRLKIEYPNAPAYSQISDAFVVNSTSAAQELIVITCPSDVFEIAITEPSNLAGSHSCISGKAVVSVDTTLLPEGASSLSVAVPLDLTISAVSISIFKDTVPPIAELDASLAMYANKHTVADYAVSGDCSDEAGRIEISAQSVIDPSKKNESTLTCNSSGIFSASLNLMSLPQGDMVVSVRHFDKAGNSVSDSLTRRKDTVDAEVPILSVTPSGSTSLSLLETAVTGTDVAGYRYKLGLQSTTSCVSDVGYSATFPVGDLLTQDLSVFADGPLRLCVLSVDVAGNVLNTANARQVDWIKDPSVSQVFMSSYSPAGSPSRFIGNRTLIVSGSGITHYKYLVINSGDCSSADFSAQPEIDIADPIVYAANSEGLYQVCAIGKSLAGTWQTTPTASATLSIDLTSPAVSIATSAPLNTSTSPIPVTLEFSEPVAGFSSSDISVSNGTVSNLSGSWSHYTFEVTPTTAGAVTISVAAAVAQDFAGNDNTATAGLTLNFDNTSPSVTIASTTASPTNATSFPVTIEFNKAVTGFTASDIVITNGTMGALSGSGTAYSFVVTRAAGFTSGNIVVAVGANVAQDSFGNFNSAATSLVMDYNSIRPTVTITKISPEFTNTSPVEFAVTFSKPITSFTPADINVANGTVSISGAGANYTVAVEPAASGSVAIQLKAESVQDAHGNQNATDSDVVSVIYDIVPPTVPSVYNNSYTTSSTSAPTINGSGADDVHSGLARSEVAVGTSMGGNQVMDWVNVGLAASFTPTGLSLVTGTAYYISVRVIDNAGNVGPIVSGQAFYYLTAPTLTSISPSSGSVAGGTTVTFTGTGFYGTMYVQIDGNNCTSIAVINSTTLTCDTPAGTVGAKTVGIGNAAYQTAELTSAFTYTAAANEAVFMNTGADQNFLVPPGVTSINIKAWGAGGATPGDPGSGAGGAGAFVKGDLPVTPGETLTVIVGGTGNPGGVGYGGGNDLGGGRSAIRRGSTELLTAGGGGAGGQGENKIGGVGGAAGAAGGSGEISDLLGLTAHGKGATGSVGGAAGTSSCTNFSFPVGAPVAGSAFQGGFPRGGGGYFGGGGAAGCARFNPDMEMIYGAGGGGSSYIDSSIQNSASAPGNGVTAGGAAERPGGSNNGDSGQTGLVIISY